MVKFEIGSLQPLEAVRDLLVVDGLYWWCEHQNNSGGYFIRNERVDHYIFAQAGTKGVAQAMLKASCAEDSYDWCECCGERFSISLWYDGTAEPTTYSESIFDGFSDMWGGGCILYLQSGLVLRTVDGVMYEVLRYE